MEALLVEERLEVCEDFEDADDEQQIHEEWAVGLEMQEQLDSKLEEVHCSVSCMIKFSPFHPHQYRRFLREQNHRQWSPCDYSFAQHQEQCW